MTVIRPHERSLPTPTSIPQPQQESSFLSHHFCASTHPVEKPTSQDSPAKVATNNAFKITKDTSARKNTRVGSIQSAVEAAAMKESHDYYVERLNEGYKQQLETMEQSYEEQIEDFTLQLATTIQRTKDEALKEVTVCEIVQASP